MIHITDKLTSGTPPKYVGVTLNESFPGTTLNATNFSGALPAGLTINNKLIAASGATDWSKYIQFTKLHMYEKQEWTINFKAVDKVASGGFGLTMSSILVSFNSVFYLKVNLSTDSNSGRVSIGLDDTTATNVGTTPALTWAAGDNLKLTIRRSPKKTALYFENLTTPANPAVYADFDLPNWGTQGLLRLAFLTGQQEINNITINVLARNYQGTGGVVFCGDSITQGTGSTSVDRRWTDIVMKGQQHMFENLGVSSWLSGTVATYLLAEVLTAINGKYFVCNIGFNDANQVSTSVFSTNLTSIVTTAQAAGYTVIIVNQFANSTADKSAYVAIASSVATANGCKYVDVFTLTKTTGNIANPNYVYTDNLHPNDDGHLVIGNEVADKCPELYSVDLLPAISNKDIQFFNLPFGKDNEEVVTIDYLGIIHRTPRKKFLDSGFIILQATIIKTQTGGFAVTGSGVLGGSLQLKSSNGLQLGFHDGTTSNTSGSNISITNGGTLGAGTPQAFDTFTGFGNIKITASSANKVKTGMTSAISGNNNTILNALCAASFSGTDCVAIGTYSWNAASGNTNILLGSNAGKGVTSGAQLIHIITRNGMAASYPNISDAMLFGDMSSAAGDAYIAGDIAFAPYIFGPARLWVGGRVVQTPVPIEISGAANAGTNAVGNNLTIVAPRGTGLAETGKIPFKFFNPTTTGATFHSTGITAMQIERLGTVFGNSTALTKALDALVDIQSTSQGFLPPRMTAAQRDALITGAISIAIATAGSAQTSGTYALVFSGHTGTPPTGYATVAGGVVTLVVLTSRGAMSVAPTSVTISSGAGVAATFTLTLGITTGLTIYCTDATATDASTGVMQTWNGTTWKNHW